MLRLAALFALLLPQVAAANTCQTVTFEDTAFTTCEVQAGEDLRLFHAGPKGNLGSFGAVNAQLAAEGKTLGFAMNAGMYHANRAPVGLLIEDGVERSEIVTSEGPGNFGLLPNGVFCIGDRFSVIESRAFAQRPPACRYATQSGPMLVMNGALHPRLIPDSDSTYIRNGVGVSADGSRAVFAISDGRVNFHRFARFFRDALGLPDALYFDGKISRLYAPAIHRNDIGFAMGPIVGTVVNRN
ncbi:phosphodiester glycosidase family protein [Pseudotabrizicola algicola]|uniref:Phosphodiester glycosidase domain-containing protein n=1 Tax=Pseudotabrizicola algicola TaxID=2709381 RepID=A0A6B3RL61_9RHOB|nr:phosphodiester glycosidase family protein [Pseudotabrizicola algicola]NEX46784.1 hypothetical protein [Pseudotabrizicola algicola]